jgi:hypothetical protein
MVDGRPGWEKWNIRRPHDAPWHPAPRDSRKQSTAQGGTDSTSGSYRYWYPVEHVRAERITYRRLLGYSSVRSPELCPIRVTPEGGLPEVRDLWSAGGATAKRESVTDPSGKVRTAQAGNGAHPYAGSSALRSRRRRCTTCGPPSSSLTSACGAVRALCVHSPSGWAAHTAEHAVRDTVPPWGPCRRGIPCHDISHGARPRVEVCVAIVEVSMQACMNARAHTSAHT